MRSLITRSLFADIVLFLLIVLFLYASLTKLLDFTRFRSTLGVSPLIGQISGFVSLFIPLSELVLCVLLSITRLQFIGLKLSLILMTGFTTYLVTMKLSGMALPCSCGGILQGMSWSVHILFNLAFILLISFAILFMDKERSASP